MNKVSNFFTSLPTLVILFLSLFSVRVDILKVVRWHLTVVWKEYLGFKSNARVIPGILEVMVGSNSCTQAHILLSFGCQCSIRFPINRHFRAHYNHIPGKHNCLAHLVSSSLCFSSQKVIFLSFLDEQRLSSILQNSNSFFFFFFNQWVCQNRVQDGRWGHRI